jgi:hypothetical protein
MKQDGCDIMNTVAFEILFQPGSVEWTCPTLVLNYFFVNFKNIGEKLL